MNDSFQQMILAATGAQRLCKLEEIQTLWSGYGTITRYGLEGVDRSSVVVKHVVLPTQSKHPRGWDSVLSHQRKIHSYQVETVWYRQYSGLCDERCVVAESLALAAREKEFLIVLEDLDASGYSVRKNTVTLQNLQLCLRWLAHFHAVFMGRTPVGLWQSGTYWHLATRPDELAALDDEALKAAAVRIDHTLKASPYQTFVHGDAKLENFCFRENETDVAAVDFQYVGGGCGMKDVAYFIGSCLGEADCERYEKPLLDYYFEQLKNALLERKIDVDVDAVERSWRPLYAVAWTDFYRFLKGWSPGHWKLHPYSERLAHQVLRQLSNDGS